MSCPHLRRGHTEPTWETRVVDDSTIRTERLTLRPLTVACAAEMVSVLADDELYAFIDGRAPTITELQARYQRLVAGSGNDDEVWFNWIVRRVSDGVAIGFMQADVTAGTVELAWLIGLRYQGSGFASEAAEALLDWFLQRGASRVTAHIHVDNLASHRVATQIGLSRTGEIDGDGESVWSVDEQTPSTCQCSGLLTADRCFAQPSLIHCSMIRPAIDIVGGIIGRSSLRYQLASMISSSCSTMSPPA